MYVHRLKFVVNDARKQHAWWLLIAMFVWAGLFFVTFQGVEWCLLMILMTLLLFVVLDPWLHRDGAPMWDTTLIPPFLLALVGSAMGGSWWRAFVVIEDISIATLFTKTIVPIHLGVGILLLLLMPLLHAWVIDERFARRAFHVWVESQVIFFIASTFMLFLFFSQNITSVWDASPLMYVIYFISWLVLVAREAYVATSPSFPNSIRQNSVVLLGVGLLFPFIFLFRALHYLAAGNKENYGDVDDMTFDPSRDYRSK